jgi:hypothetical protein
LNLTKAYHYEPCPRCRELGNDNRGDNLVVYSNGHSHCFACGYHNYPKYHKPTTQEVSNVPKSVRPSDFTREVPVEGWQWLLQYGLPYSHWKDCTGYSEEAGRRLVFEVSDNGRVAFSIGRLLDEATKHSRKWYVWGDSHKHCHVVGQGRGTSTLLVEDLISAHKVGEVTEAIPLFGTTIHPCHLYYLMTNNRPVVLWLDKDQELHVKKKALQLESLIDKSVKIITTDKDPKALSFTQIKELTNE